jgi:hypothetical protein
MDVHLCTLMTSILGFVDTPGCHAHMCPRVLFYHVLICGSYVSCVQACKSESRSALGDFCHDHAAVLWVAVCPWLCLHTSVCPGCA